MLTESRQLVDKRTQWKSERVKSRKNIEIKLVLKSREQNSFQTKEPGEVQKGLQENVEC